MRNIGVIYRLANDFDFRLPFNLTSQVKLTVRVNCSTPPLFQCFCETSGRLKMVAIDVMWSDLILLLSFYVDCGNSATVANGTIDFSNKETTYGQVIPVSCNTGFEIMGRGFIECQKDGTWSTTTTCEIIGMKFWYCFVQFLKRTILVPIYLDDRLSHCVYIFSFLRFNLKG